MKIFTTLCRFPKKMRRRHHRGVRLSLLIFLFSVSTGWVSAQTLSWSESFQAGVPTSLEQCEKWNAFLDQLSGKNFASVTLSGTLDPTGKSINDPVAATELARLLTTRTRGSVQVGSEYWTVYNPCGTSVCGTGPNIELSINNTPGGGCDCLSNYAIRPAIAGTTWGSVGGYTCPGQSQTIRLEFNSGVSIVASGPTDICPDGGSVTLTATTKICSGPYTYLWSNGATTESITVTEPGNYSVSVTSSQGCTGTSAATEVTTSAVSVDAGEDVTVCSDPIQLVAAGFSGGGSSAEVNKYCVFDAPGGAGNCSFTDNLCSVGDGSEKVTNSTFSQAITVAKPDELRVLLYYSPYTTTTFTFKLNGQPIGTFVETNATGDCEPGKHQQYPHTITFTKDELDGWNDSGANNFSVDVTADEAGVYVAGVVIETENAHESYVWSPTAGLSDAMIANPMAQPATTTTYTVTYTDAAGCSASDQVTVTVNCNTAPVAVCKPVTVEADANCEALVAAADFDAGSSSPSGSPLTFSISPQGPYAVGETAITLTVTDANGESSSCSTTLTVIDSTFPTIRSPLDVTATNDPGACSATVILSPPEASDNCGITSVTNDHQGNVFAVGETTVTWTVKDVHGNETTAIQKVIVTNIAPAITSVTASPATAAPNEDVTLTVAYIDNNVKTAVIAWGDSQSETIANPEASFHLSHRYQHEGTYAVTVTVTDQCDATTSGASESIIIVSKHAGSVKGNGWFDSKPGYYVKDRRAAGKAQFHFSASYAGQGGELQGKITFTFKEGSIDFKSTGLDMLDVDGPNAFLTGSGKLNNKKDYRILIGMYDDDPKGDEIFTPAGKPDAPGGKKDNHPGHKKVDRIRVKIWDPHGIVVYDTQAGSADDALASIELGGGSIVVSSSGLDDLDDDDIASHFEEGSTDVYPNPFEDWLSLHFTSESREKVNLQLMDLAGKVIFNQTYPVSDDDSYSIDLPKGTHKGVYVLVITQGKRVEFLRVIGK